MTHHHTHAAWLHHDVTLRETAFLVHGAMCGLGRLAVSAALGLASLLITVRVIVGLPDTFADISMSDAFAAAASLVVAALFLSMCLTIFRRRSISIF